MTAIAQSQSRSSASAQSISTSRDWIAFVITVILLLGIYLPLQNPYWVPGGDSEVYTSIARNLITGKGFTFNGLPVGMAPPGWPLALAAAMKISPAFSWLKIIVMLCMTGSLAISYWICRRYASPRLSALVIILCGILSYIYSLTFWLHSDALFCLTSSWSVLLAMQINEKKPHKWRIPLLIFLCALNVLVRWAGVLTWLIVAAALVEGQLLPRKNRQWLALILSGIMTCGTFVILHRALALPPSVARQIKEFGGTSEEGSGTLAEKADATVATGYTLLNPAAGGWRGVVGRAGRWGNWFAYMLWQPLRLGASNNLVGIVALMIGWCVLIPLLVQGWQAALVGRWIWPMILVYSFGLALNWPQPNARYLVPIAPLIILGVFKFFEILRQTFPAKQVATTSKVLLGYFAASILLCNGALWAVDVHVARSPDFYDKYEAGLNTDLIYADHWLIEHPPLDEQIAVPLLYKNLGRTRSNNPLGLRITTMLTGKAIVSVPGKYLRAGDPRKNPNFLAWARALGIKYVLYNPEVSPWRVFHFRVPWLQEAMTGEPAIDSGAGWRLYEITPWPADMTLRGIFAQEREIRLTRLPPDFGEAIRISVPPVPNWPTRVPGI